MNELHVKSRLKNLKDILETEEDIPSSADVSEAIKQAIEADKDIISQIVVTYDEDNDRTILKLPSNVLPLKFYDLSLELQGITDGTVYFNYLELTIVDDNNITVGGIEFNETENYCILSFDSLNFTELEGGELSYCLFNHSDYELNTYNLYHSNLEGIRDSLGHKRFVEGDITCETIAGLTQTYGKWSLSGSHLMVVIAGNFENGTVMTAQTFASNIDIPSWIKDKIYPTFSSVVDVKSVSFSANDWTNQSATITLRKSGTAINIVFENNITFTATRNFRVQFDLLIDNNE